MKKLMLCLMLMVPALVGCPDKPKPVVVEEPLVPTPRERKLLSTYNLKADTEIGQKKLRKIRERTAKLEAAQERVKAWGDEAQRREEEEAALAN